MMMAFLIQSPQTSRMESKHVAICVCRSIQRSCIKTSLGGGEQSHILTVTPPTLRASSSNRSRQHVLGDLEPYVCISEECRDPPILFSEESEWREHMHDIHGMCWVQEIYKPLQWCCDLGHETSHLYRSREELGKHLAEVHSHQLTPQKRAIFAGGSSVLSRSPPNTCPLCDSVPEDIRGIMEHSQSNAPSANSRESPRPGPQVKFNPSLHETFYLAQPYAWGDGQDGQVISPREYTLLLALEKHIASHLKSLAFISIHNLFSDEVHPNASAQALIKRESNGSCSNSRDAHFDDTTPPVFDDIPSPKQVPSMPSTDAPPESYLSKHDAD